MKRIPTATLTHLKEAPTAGLGRSGIFDTLCVHHTLPARPGPAQPKPKPNPISSLTYMTRMYCHCHTGHALTLPP